MGGGWSDGGFGPGSGDGRRRVCVIGDAGRLGAVDGVSVGSTRTGGTGGLGGSGIRARGASMRDARRSGWRRGNAMTNAAMAHWRPMETAAVQRSLEVE